MTKAHDRGRLLERAQELALEIVAGTTSPSDGASRIHVEVVEQLDHPFALRAWCALEAGLDPADDRFEPIEPQVLDEAIRAHAERLSVADLDDLERQIASQWKSMAGLGWQIKTRALGPALEWATQLWARMHSAVRRIVRGPKGMAEQRSLRLRSGLRAVSAVLLASGVLIWGVVFVAIVPVLVFIKVASAVVILLPLLAFIGNLLFDWGRVIGAKTAVEAMDSSSNDAPVLYLRSFAIDKADENRDDDDPLAFRPQEEEILASIFKFAGPFVAVGDPDDAMLRRGAARAYLSQDDWQEHVERLMKHSAIVILRVSDTPGFLWEADLAVRELRPDQVLFYFSQHLNTDDLEKLYQSLVRHIGDKLPLPLPSSIGSRRFIRFGSDWQPVLFGSMSRATEFKTWPRSAPVSAVLTHRRWRERLSRSLQPFFEDRMMFDPERSMFSDRAVLTASLLASPLAAGIMMARNLWAAGKRSYAITALILASLTAVGLFHFLKWGGQRLAGILAERTSMVTQYWTSSVWLILVAYVLINVTFYRLWVAFGAKSVRQHLLFGGPRVRWWSTGLVLVGSVVWWWSIARVVSLDMLPDYLRP